MCNFKRLKIAVVAMLTVVLTACGEEDEQVLPMPQDVTVERFDSCVSGRGWVNVSSREVKQNGVLAKEEYWSNPDAGKPQQYFFSGDTLTTFLSTDAFAADGYQESRYAYKRAEHKLISTAGEVFKLISVSEDELCVLQYKGFSGNGEKIYIYSIYRPMDATELQLCRNSHPYNLATINTDYPTLPEQMLITPTEFKQNAVNQGWKCTAAYPMETAGRYVAAGSRTAAVALTPDDIYITTDSIVAFKRGVMHGFTVSGRQKYSFRANSFTLDTGTGTSLRILTLTADEMRLLITNGTNGQTQSHGTYCIYKRMTVEELAAADKDSSRGTAHDS